MSITPILAEPIRADKPFILQGQGRTYELDYTAFEAALHAAIAVSEFERSEPNAGQAITTGEAAKILGVSQKTVQRILDAGKIPYTRNGERGNRMMREHDVLLYKAQMQHDRKRALRQMRTIAKDMNLYDINM